jgi:hypothetical protein
MSFFFFERFFENAERSDFVIRFVLFGASNFRLLFSFRIELFLFFLFQITFLKIDEYVVYFVFTKNIES